jgi:Beta propeller domain
MAPRRTPRLLPLALTLVAALPLAACTAHRPRPQPAATPGAAVPAVRLVAYDNCARLLADLRDAAARSVGPAGFPGAPGAPADGAMPGRAMAGAPPAAAPVPAFSGTNDHEADADEPDIVKTDGRRIVTLTGGVLRVVDAATRRLTGRLDLGAEGFGGLGLLLSGDRAVVLVQPGTGPVVLDGPLGPRRPGGPYPGDTRARVLLVDLAGAPRVLSRYTADGVLAGARLAGGVARVLLRSAPRVAFPLLPGRATDDQRTDANTGALRRAGLAAWLPSWQVTTGGRTATGRVGCDRVSRPAEFSGSSLVTVLTFDPARGDLGDGDPVAVLADGDTVYGTASSLYVAGDQRWRGRAVPLPAQRTQIYRFALTGAARPAYAAAGSVPGYLLNQYALSEWDGRLRAATTDPAGQRSAVRVLEQHGGSLDQVGEVDGLGRGERIYAVRFLGPRAYVVTFRQTDPLFTVDLGDPRRPRVAGTLELTGYSAHLQPVGEGRLVGIGQEADARGAVRGSQVSLFDVSDPAAPRRLARQVVPYGMSQAEWDPHALLWWPATGLLVVPMTVLDPHAPRAGAAALRVTADGLADLGTVTQPARQGGAPEIRRALVVGDTLWTVSDSGLLASGVSTMERRAWLPNA